MGEARVHPVSTQKQIQSFEKQLLKDLYALERMLDEGWFEIDKTRIGAEQEFCLVDKNQKAAPKAMEMLGVLNDEMYTHELAQFNMETNVPPFEFNADCLSKMENCLVDFMAKAKTTAESMNLNVILCGILPTLRKYDVGMHNITPIQRYHALCDAIDKIRGKVYDLKINGVDELSAKHDSPLLEAANTGFQVHLQVRPDEFVKMYNIAQAITAPVLAASVNSPILFFKRLWHETRIALFTQSVDVRKNSNHLRESLPRVTFGNTWLKDSILDIYKEDIVRYRALLSAELKEDVVRKMKSGEAPDLHALRVHNGTVYRWNRPCYGLSSKQKAHLRIENRVLPSGPSIIDEVSNAALWLGLMNGYKTMIEDMPKMMDFSDARANFIKAARSGVDNRFAWFDGKKFNAKELIIEELLPVAEQGLKSANINKADIDRYLNVIDKRVSSGQTGSTWTLQSFSNLNKVASKEEAFSAITAATIKHQATNKPVHEWPEANLNDISQWEPSTLLVEEYMTKDLITIRKDDILQLATEMMDWKKVRYIPVEDKNDRLVGLVTSRLLLRAYSKRVHQKQPLKDSVGSIMIKNPITIDPEATVIEAMNIMAKNEIGCLPVVRDGHLLGILTEQDFLSLSRRLFIRLSNL